MNFSDEVNAAKSAKVHEEKRWHELEKVGRRRFDAEVRGLWGDTEEYWRSNAERMDSKAVNYVVTGRWEGEDGVLATLPFPHLLVYVGTKTRTEWTNGDVRPSESVSGINVGPWFALCAPGEIRELVSDPSFDVGELRMTAAGLAQTRNRIRQAMEQSYRQVPWSTVQNAVGGDDDSTFGMAFLGPEGRPDVALRCGANGPTEVFIESTDGWSRVGTLRELVVSAVAKLPLSGKSSRNG